MPVVISTEHARLLSFRPSVAPALSFRPSVAPVLSFRPSEASGEILCQKIPRLRFAPLGMTMKVLSFRPSAPVLCRFDRAPPSSVISTEALAEWRNLVVNVFTWLVRFLDFSLAAFARNDNGSCAITPLEMTMNGICSLGMTENVRCHFDRAEHPHCHFDRAEHPHCHFDRAKRVEKSCV